MKIVQLYYGAIYIVVTIAVVYGYVLFIKVMKRILKVLDFIINKNIKCDNKEEES